MRNTEETPHFRISITSPSFPGTIPTKTGTSVTMYKQDSTTACPKKKDIRFPTKMTFLNNSYSWHNRSQSGPNRASPTTLHTPQFPKRMTDIPLRGIIPQRDQVPAIRKRAVHDRDFLQLRQIYSPLSLTRTLHIQQTRVRRGRYAE